VDLFFNAGFIGTTLTSYLYDLCSCKTILCVDLFYTGVVRLSSEVHGVPEAWVYTSFASGSFVIVASSGCA
jgi:hypothetical protein